MTAPVLLREFTCPVCGAPRTRLDGALVVLCAHCGAILAHGGDGLWEETSIASRHAAGIRQIVKPTAAQARLLALSIELEACRDPAERARWRLLAGEQLLLVSVVHADAVAPLPTDPRERAKHVAEGVALHEIATFDARVAMRMNAYASACGGLTKGDPVVAARQMLEGARAYYEALASHPDRPPGALREGSEHHARELVRQAIGGYASLLGASAIERIRALVLGDALGEATRCPKCGAPLDGSTSGLQRCRHCEALTRVDVDDAWTTAQLGLWAFSCKDLVRRGELDGPAPVIAAIGGFVHTGARDVPVAKAVLFLERAIPWVEPADLALGLDLLAHAVTDDGRALLDGVREATRGWQADPAKRPVRAAAVSTWAPPSEADEAAWIASALALWTMRRGSLLELLAHPLGALQVAAVHEVSTGVSARAAMSFFEQARPGWNRAEMLVELGRLAPGYDHPRVRAFTRELAELLGADQ